MDGGQLSPAFRQAVADYFAGRRELIPQTTGPERSYGPVGTETMQGAQPAGAIDPVMYGDVTKSAARPGGLSPFDIGMSSGANIRAFHGSPYAFDRFDASKIGTGEGAQAYGHGLYLAGSEDVARTYKTAGPASNAAYDAINARLSDLARQMDKIQIPGGYRKWRDPALGQQLADEYDTLLKQKSNGLGHMYEVNLRTTPDQLLDWDKPLSQQPAGVREAIQPRVDAIKQQFISDASTWGTPTAADLASYQKQADELVSGMRGENFYHANRWRQESDAAAEALRNAGIPGIQYLDAGSRGIPAQWWDIGKGVKGYDRDALMRANDYVARNNIGGETPQQIADALRGAGHGGYADLVGKYADQITMPDITRNYVIFPGNEHLIDIVRRYGWAGLMAAGGPEALAQLSGQQQTQ